MREILILILSVLCASLLFEHLLVLDLLCDDIELFSRLSFARSASVRAAVTEKEANKLTI